MTKTSAVAKVIVSIRAGHHHKAIYEIEGTSTQDLVGRATELTEREFEDIYGWDVHTDIVDLGCGGFTLRVMRSIHEVGKTKGRITEIK